MNEVLERELKNALHLLTHADQILESVEHLIPKDKETTRPMVAASFWIARSMCLLIDELEGVDDVAWVEEDRIPMARTENPYAYLTARFGVLAAEYESKANNMTSLWTPID